MSETVLEDVSSNAGKTNSRDAESANTKSSDTILTITLEGIKEGEVQKPKTQNVDANVISLGINAACDKNLLYDANASRRKQFFVYFMQQEPLPPTGETLNYGPDRNSFLRLVFGILLVMLLATAAFNITVLNTSLKDIFIDYGLLILVPATIVAISINYAMNCCSCARVPPGSIICLIVIVICMSLITAYFTSRYKTTVVMNALLATSITIFVCFCLACTSFDFTRFMLYIYVVSIAFAAIALCIMLTMLITKTYYKTVHLVILIVGTIINVIILTMELQFILGGRTVELGEQDYAFGAFMLYTSIIDIFIKYMQILNILDM